MSAYPIGSWSTMVWLALEATAILGAAALLQWAWRERVSAATRHFTWTVVVLGLLALPAMRQIAPAWPVPIASDIAALPIAPVTLATDTASVVDAPAADGALTPLATLREAAPAAATPSPASIALAVYLLGVAGVFLTAVLHRWQTRRLAARAHEVTDPAWTTLLAETAGELGVSRRVRLLQSRDAVMPMTFGTREPSILIPAVADLWTDDRRRAVLLHELAHVARYDCLTQTIALAACAVYWPHPGVWFAARRLRVERELACDDRVLAAGAEAHAYAGHLLEIAYSLDGRRAPALAVTMARPSQLEGRLLSALDAARNRRRPGRAASGALVAVAATAVMAVAGATPTRTETMNLGAGETALAPLTPTLSPQAARGASTDDRDGQPGTWTLRPSDKAGMVHLRLVEGDSTNGTTVPISALEGLTAAQLEGQGGPIQFRITRDAGAFLFEGVLRSGVAGGTFSFSPNAAFPAELAKRGYARPSARQQYQLARHDIGYAFLDELNKQNYAKSDVDGLVTAGQHGVNLTYLREMGALGYQLGTLPPLVTLRDHGVTPDYVRGMAQEGYDKLPADTIRQARDHGITPDYVKALNAAGYKGLPLDRVVQARDHGISIDYMNGMRALGHTPPLDELVTARDHGVDPEYIRGMQAAGHTQVPLDRLITARDHGVTPEYALGMKKIGYEGLSLDELVKLRDHGVTPERVAAANARAGTKLPIDVLRSLADGGGLR